MQLSSRVIVITNQSFLIMKKGMYLERQINKSVFVSNKYKRISKH